MKAMQTPIESNRTYQIFKREADNTTVCVEVVKGLQQARNRMEQARIASAASDLFVFDPLTQKVVDPSELAETADPLTP
jgi:hypothetical protein